MTQKSAPEEDLRIRRTRKMLQQAMIDLSAEKGFAAITVRDITERAMVNRSTFYRHYEDKYCLLDDYLIEVNQLVSAEDFVAEKLGQRSDSVPAGLVAILTHVQMHSDFYRVMLGERGDAGFQNEFRKLSERRFLYLLDSHPAITKPGQPPVELTIRYVACAGVSAILWWLDHGQDYTVEQMATWLGQLSATSVGLSIDLDKPLRL